MKKIQLIRGKAFNASHRPGCTNEYTPYSFRMNGLNYFIRNLTSSNGQVKTPHNKSDRRDFSALIKQLRKNDYQYFCFYAGTFSSPIELIQYVIENKKTFERHGEFFIKSETGNFTDFHGNLCEVSCAFRFRIYDQEFLNQVKKAFAKAKTKIHY